MSAASPPDELKPPQLRAATSKDLILPWKTRVIVVDPDRETVRIRNETNIVQENHTKLSIPPGTTEFTIFVDPETASRPTLRDTTEDEHCNVMLMTIYVNRLPMGFCSRLLRKLRMIKTVYVTKMDTIEGTEKEKKVEFGDIEKGCHNLQQF